MNKKLEALARTEASTKQSRASFVVQRPSAYSRSILTSSETIFERKARLIILGWVGTWRVGRFRLQMISMQAPAHPCWGTAPNEQVRPYVVFRIVLVRVCDLDGGFNHHHAVKFAERSAQCVVRDCPPPPPPLSLCTRRWQHCGSPSTPLPPLPPLSPPMSGDGA
jgi:hypothetical protein